MKAQKTSRPTYNPSHPKFADTVINVTRTAWMEWTGCAVYITESVWELIAVTPDPRGVQTNARLRDLLFALWCGLFGKSMDILKFEILAPVWPPKMNEPQTVPLHVKYAKSFEGNAKPSFIIMLPNEYL